MLQREKIIIAIDGYSSTGKSTLAKDLANALCYIYIDTGAMYRAVTYYFLENNINISDPHQIINALNKIHLEFKDIDGATTLFLNQHNIEPHIRTIHVSDMVSHVAALSSVRKMLVQQQQKMGTNKGIVMDGRDIGTVVFPEAELKIFVTAEIETRVKRRYQEMKNKGFIISRQKVKDNLLKRDQIDSSRKDSPLYQAVDAKLLDNTNMSKQQQLDKLLAWSTTVLNTLSATKS